MAGLPGLGIWDILQRRFFLFFFGNHSLDSEHCFSLRFSTILSDLMENIHGVLYPL